MLYTIIAVFFFVTSYIYDVKRCLKFKRQIYWFQFFVLFILAGIRYRIGTDSIRYEHYFDVVPNIFDLEESDFILYVYDPLWTIYNSFLKTISKDFVILQLVTSFIINIAIFKTSRKYSRFAFTVILFYYIFDYLLLNFEFMRQSLAVAIFLLFGVPSLMGKKWLKYILIVIVCTGIHFSSLITITFPVVLNIKMKFSRIIIFLSLMIIVSIIYRSLLFQISSNIHFADSIISHRFRAYSNMPWLSIEYYNIFFYISRWYLPIFIGSVLIILNKKIKISKFLRFNNFIFLFMIIAILASFADVLGRTKYFASILFFISLAETYIILIRKFHIRQRLFVKILIIIILIPTVIQDMQYQYPNGVRTYRKYFPYYTIFNPQEDKDRELLIGH